MASFQFDHYCKTFQCKMSRQACVARQLLAIKPVCYRLNANQRLVCHGLYPECFACPTGRQVARHCGINLRRIREQLASLRSQIEEGPLGSSYSIQPYRQR